MSLQPRVIARRRGVPQGGQHPEDVGPGLDGAGDGGVGETVLRCEGGRTDGWMQ